MLILSKKFKDIYILSFIMEKGQNSKGEVEIVWRIPWKVVEQ